MLLRTHSRSVSFLLGRIAALGLLLHAAPAAALVISHVGTYATGGGASGEISAYDPATRRLFVTDSGGSALRVVDVSNPAAPVQINVIPLGGDPTHVAVKDGVVAVGVVAPLRTDPGTVRFYEAADWGPGAPATPALATVTVGALPDMVTFAPDGRVLVANEGEPNSYNQPGSVDPQGSVSIIDLSGGYGAPTTTTADFTAFNGQLATLQAAGVRIFGPNATVAQDIEPEFISVSPDGTQAFVTLQENNAVAVLDLGTNAITEIRPLGLKDHSLPGAGLDPSDRDGPGSTQAISIQNRPVLGMYQPDGIASFEANGITYTVTANEGDARAYTGFNEESRVNAAGYVLDPTVFPDAATLKNNAVLGRLTVTTATGNTDGDTQFEEIHAFGARSFTIWDDAGNIVFDSGDEFEQITALVAAASFNSDGSPATFDTRSDNKGPEPEGLVVAEILGRTYAFVGLERIGGFMVYDVTDPGAASFVAYERGPLTDFAPEGLIVFEQDDISYLAVSNEVSGTVSLFSVVPEPGTAVLLLGGLGALSARRRKRS